MPTKKEVIAKLIEVREIRRKGNNSFDRGFTIGVNYAISLLEGES